MRIQLHKIGTATVAEVLSEEIILRSGGDMLDLLMQARGKGAVEIVLHAESICPEFFDLKSGIAGDVLQKLVNYRGRLAIIGDISRYLEKSESLRALVRESNRGKDVAFMADLETLLSR